MAENVNPNDAVKGGVVSGATDDEAKFKAWLKEKYDLEDDPETFKTKRSGWQKAETEIPQYQSTLSALIEHIKKNEAEVQNQRVRAEPDQFDEERVRQISRQDPYEGTKQVLGRFANAVEQRIEERAKLAEQNAENARIRNEGLKRAHDIVKTAWPEAFDQNSELHKEGRKIFQSEMTQMEKDHPMAFLIATERAAGRVGLPPVNKRRGSNSSRRDSVSAQSVSRGGQRPNTDDDDKPLNPRQRQVASAMGVDEKVYKEAVKIRKAQKKKTEDDD